MRGDATGVGRERWLAAIPQCNNEECEANLNPYWNYCPWCGHLTEMGQGRLREKSP